MWSKFELQIRGDDSVETRSSRLVDSYDRIRTYTRSTVYKRVLTRSRVRVTSVRGYSYALYSMSIKQRCQTSRFSGRSPVLAGDLPFSRCFFNFLPLSRLWSWYSRFGLAKPSALCAKAHASEHACTIDRRSRVRARSSRAHAVAATGFRGQGTLMVEPGHTA